MDKWPLLSIFIPTKKGISTIAIAIESYLLIKRTDLQIIVQDCSDDYQVKMICSRQHPTRLLYHLDLVASAIKYDNEAFYGRSH